MRYLVVFFFLSISSFWSVPAFAGSKVTTENKNGGWVKLCDKAKFKNGVKKTICLTHHERMSTDTGLVMFSAAVRKIEGQKKQRFMIMVPHAMSLAHGVHATIDDGNVYKLPFTICTPGGCTAERNTNSALFAELKKGKPVNNKAYHANRKKIIAGIRMKKRPLYPVDVYAVDSWFKENFGE